MIAPPAGVKIWLVAGVTDMRRGFDGLASLVAQQLKQDPFSGQIFAFRGRRGHLIKLLFWDGQGLVLSPSGSSAGSSCGHPRARASARSRSPLRNWRCSGIDGRAPVRTWRPEM